MADHRYVDMEGFEGSEGYAKINYPDSGSTEGAGPCVAFGIYDQVKKFAYVGHVGSFSTDIMERVMDLISKECSSADNLVVKIAGGQHLSREVCEDENDFQENVRITKEVNSRFLRIIRLYGVRKENIESRLGDVSVMDFGIEADTDKGTIEITSSDYFDYSW